MSGQHENCVVIIGLDDDKVEDVFSPDSYDMVPPKPCPMRTNEVDWKIGIRYISMVVQLHLNHGLSLMQDPHQNC